MIKEITVYRVWIREMKEMKQIHVTASPMLSVNAKNP
jgi:hypothetical protein